MYKVLVIMTVFLSITQRWLTSPCHADSQCSKYARVVQFSSVPEPIDTDSERHLQLLIAGARPGAVIKLAANSRYDLYAENATRAPYNITNTASEATGTIRVIALLLKNLHDVTIDGQGSLLMLHGTMTAFVIDHCDGITIKNLHVDIARPLVSEFSVVAIAGNSMDVRIHKDSTYVISEGALLWTGDGVPPDTRAAQEYDPSTNRTWRCWNPVSSAETAVQLAPNLVRLIYPTPPQATVGDTFQVRNDTRVEVGALITQSKNVNWINVGMHAMDGLGMVNQFSEDISFDHMDFSPRPSTGRTCDSFADFMQFSGCRGLVNVLNSNFSGAQDDGINVHGTHLQVESLPSPNQIVVQFMNDQTWGLPAFQPGDVIDFVNSDTLIPYGSDTVVSVDRLSIRQFLLTLVKPDPSRIALQHDVVENATWTPNVLIRGCRFARIPTRGVLVSTRGKVVIADNTFYRMPMSSILIADDAKSWYESGMVRDVTILKNIFNNCASPVIAVQPDITKVDANQPVHHNIRIMDNTFFMPVAQVVGAVSADGLSFSGNDLVGTGWPTANLVPGEIALDGCTNVTIIGNSLTD